VSEQAAKTFDTTAIKPRKPQQSETYITSAENATDKSLATVFSPSSKTVLPEIVKMLEDFVEAQSIRKKKATKCRGRRPRRESDEPDDNHFHEKLRHLWTMKRQVRRNSNSAGINEHSGAASDNRLRRTQQRVPPKFQLALHRVH
jgi:hypothetical protein